MKIILLFLTIANFYNVEAEENPIVSTKNGMVKGEYKISKTGKKVETWNRIPYAKPPLDDLRFLPPQPVDKWDGILDTKPLPNACFQLEDFDFGNEKWNLNVPMSEDCLYLTIVTPHPRPKNAAVLFWIYGGGFNFGSTTLDLYDYKTLSSVTDVIVVAPQYRLGPLGFLATENNEIHGNAGLRDQYLALKWIHENINNFGGDPSKITLMGESAGSASVGYHLMSSFSKPLFSQAIMESGVTNNIWALQPRKMTSLNTLNLANDVGCLNHKNNVDVAIECLKKTNASEITKHSFSLTDQTMFRFCPNVDGEFITEDPYEFVNDPKNKIDKNILIGSTKDEGALSLYMIFPDIFPLNSTKPKITHSIFNSIVKNMYQQYPESIIQLISYEYTNWKNINDGMDNAKALRDLLSDTWFTCGINEFIDFIVKNSSKKIYRYVFSHHSSQSKLPEWTGAAHADDLYFVFGDGLNPDMNYTEEEKLLSLQIMKYFGNFAKNGYSNLSVGLY